MSLVNQVPKIVPDDFETMLNSNINVSAVSRLLGACAFPYLVYTHRCEESWWDSLEGDRGGRASPLAPLLSRVGGRNR